MIDDCFGCIGAIRFQREQYRKIINQARETAKKENRTVTIYLTDSGEYTLDITPIISQYITPHL